MKFNPLKPYNDLPDLPPRINIETNLILKNTISASRALAELKGALNNLPNPHLFVDTINLQEAQASSEIENIVTTQDALFQASIAEKQIENFAIKEVIHYKDALWFGIEQLNKKPILSTNLFIKIVQIIKKNDSGIRNLPGTQLSNPITSKIIYTPPEGVDIIRQKLKSLEEFINTKDEIDPLIKMALIHYQFEAIHPFFDGNGRTGRILILLYLKLSGLMEFPSLFLSSYILQNKNDYYLKLRNVTEKNDWEGWIVFMLKMVEITSNKAKDRIIKIEELMKIMSNEIKNKIPKIYSKELVDILFHLPYTKRMHLEKAELGNLKTVGNYLNRLEEKGILKSVFLGKEKLYLNYKLMEILQGKT